MAPSDPHELSRRARAVNDLLARIEASTANGSLNEWWNLTAYEELGGRTPTQVWLAGDHEAVEELVRSWYARSEEAAQTTRANEGLLRTIEERRRAIARSATDRRTA